MFPFLSVLTLFFLFFFFFNDTATTEIYTLSLHDALPIYCASFFQNHFVSFEKTRDLYRCFLPATRRPRDHSCLGHVCGHCKADAAQQLNPLGDLIHEFVLLPVMLIKEQMELVKRMARDLPVMFFVHIAECYRVREKLIQVLGTGCAGLFIQSNRQLGDLAIRLNFRGVLVLNRPSLFRACFELVISSIALVMFGAHGYLSSGRNWLESQGSIIRV